MLRDEIFEFPALQLDTLLGEPLGKLGYFAVPLSALGENFNDFFPCPGRSFLSN